MWFWFWPDELNKTGNQKQTGLSWWKVPESSTTFTTNCHQLLTANTFTHYPSGRRSEVKKRLHTDSNIKNGNVGCFHCCLESNLNAIISVMTWTKQTQPVTYLEVFWNRYCFNLCAEISWKTIATHLSLCAPLYCWLFSYSARENTPVMFKQRQHSS